MCPGLCALDAVRACAVVQANLRKHEQKLLGGGRATSTIIFIRLGRNAAAAGMRRPGVSGCVFRRRRLLLWRLYHACLCKHPVCTHTGSEKQNLARPLRLAAIIVSAKSLARAAHDAAVLISRVCVALGSLRRVFVPHLARRGPRRGTMCFTAAPTLPRAHVRVCFLWSLWSVYCYTRKASDGGSRPPHPTPRPPCLLPWVGNHRTGGKKEQNRQIAGSD